MLVYLSNILFLVLLSIFSNRAAPVARPGPLAQQSRPAVLCVCFALCWISISTLRDFSVGADTYAYYDRYLRSSNVSWGDVWSTLVDYILSGLRGPKDPGYLLIEKTFHQIGLGYRALLAFIAVAFMLPLAYRIYKDSRAAFFSVILYSVLFYAFFSITGHRQTIATAILFTFAVPSIYRRNPFAFFGAVGIAALIHKSALLFAPAYLFVYVKPSKTLILTAIILSPLAILIREPLLNLATILLGYEYSDLSSAVPVTFSISLATVALLSLFRVGYLDTSDVRIRVYICALLVAALCTPLVFGNPVIMRVVQYYSIFLLWLIPELIFTFGPRVRRVLLFAAPMALIALFVATGAGGEYRFFWAA